MRPGEYAAFRLLILLCFAKGALILFFSLFHAYSPASMNICFSHYIKKIPGEFFIGDFSLVKAAVKTCRPKANR